MADFSSDIFTPNPPADTSAVQRTQGADFASDIFAPPIPRQGAKAPRNIPPKAIAEPSRAASVSTAFMGGIPTEKQAAINTLLKLVVSLQIDMQLLVAI